MENTFFNQQLGVTLANIQFHQYLAVKHQISHYVNVHLTCGVFPKTLEGINNQFVKCCLQKFVLIFIHFLISFAYIEIKYKYENDTKKWYTYSLLYTHITYGPWQKRTYFSYNVPQSSKLEPVNLQITYKLFCCHVQFRFQLMN